MDRGDYNSSLVGRVLKRNPLAEQTLLTQSAEVYPPPKLRAAWGSFDVAASIAVQGGFVYFPPANGGIIRLVGAGQIAGSVPWSMGLLTEAEYTGSGSGAFGNTRVRPVYTDAPLRGALFSTTLFGLGNFYSQHIRDSAVKPNLPVMPGNVFVCVNGTTNSAFTGFCYVEEYLSGDEQL
jgi:hypothetical protein